MMQSYALCSVYAIVVPYDVQSCPLRREKSLDIVDCHLVILSFCQNEKEKVVVKPL